MRRFVFSPPPTIPPDLKADSSLVSYLRQLQGWGQLLIERMENDSRENMSPTTQTFIVTNYTTSTALTLDASTATAAQIADFLGNLVNALNQKGVTRSKA